MALHLEEIRAEQRESGMVVGIAGGVAQRQGIFREPKRGIGILLEQDPGFPVGQACACLARIAGVGIFGKASDDAYEVAARHVEEGGPLHHGVEGFPLEPYGFPMRRMMVGRRHGQRRYNDCQCKKQSMHTANLAFFHRQTVPGRGIIQLLYIICLLKN